MHRPVTITQRSQSHFVLLGRCWRSWYGDENASVALVYTAAKKPSSSFDEAPLDHHTTSMTNCHCSFNVSKSSPFWFTSAKVACVTGAPAILDSTSSMLDGENATTLAGENAARWITARVDWPPFPATTEPLHRDVCTNTLVVRSSDAVVSDSQEVVDKGRRPCR